MTENRRRELIPTGHAVFRALVGSLVLSLAVTGLVLAGVHAAGELAFGRIIWISVRNWALP